MLLKKAGKTPVWAVLKGYGLGVAPMAALCWEKGVRRFAVTEPDEAQTIREQYKDAQILMLRPTADQTELNRLLDLDVIATIGSSDAVFVLDEREVMLLSSDIVGK